MTESSDSVWQSAPPAGGSAGAQTSTVHACVSYQIFLYKMQPTNLWEVKPNTRLPPPVSLGVPDYRMAILA